MAAFSVLSKEEIDQELSPEEVEEQENCNSQQINEVASPFANLLKNFLGGGGRERKARIQGTWFCTTKFYYSNFFFKKQKVEVDSTQFMLWTTFHDFSYHSYFTWNQF